jgi:hypothetical protein
MPENVKPYRLKVSLSQEEYLKFKDICRNMGKPMSKVLLEGFSHHMRTVRQEKINHKEQAGIVDVVMR